MKNYFVENLKKLADKYSQKIIAQKTGFSQASINKYINGTSEPSLSFLIALHNAFGINIDNFLFELYETEEEMEVSSDKFLGNYLVYYYNNTAYKGEVASNFNNTLSYGLLSVFKDESNNYKSCATFLKDKKTIIKLFEKLNKTNDTGEIISLHKEHNNFYFGKLHSNLQNMFIQLSNTENKDECFLIFNNPPSVNNYIGGIGTINSISRGRENNPCVQYVLIAKNIIERTDGEIYNCLHLGRPSIDFSNTVKDLITLMKNLYLENDKLSTNLTDMQKETLIENQLKFLFSDIIEANMFRFAKVSNREDDFVYKMLKDGSYIE